MLGLQDGGSVFLLYVRDVAKISRPKKIRFEIRQICFELVFGKRVVRITVEPSFTGLGGRDNRMPGGVRMFRSMPIWRTIAAPGPATLLTRPQMHPRGADLHALLADALAWMFDFRYAVDVRADFSGHGVSLPLLLSRQ